MLIYFLYFILTGIFKQIKMKVVRHLIFNLVAILFRYADSGCKNKKN